MGTWTQRPRSQSSIVQGIPSSQSEGPVQGGASGVLVPADALAKVRPQAKGAAILTAPDSGRALGALASGWRHRLPAVQVVCITGSTGKTSTKK